MGGGVKIPHLGSTRFTRDSQVESGPIRLPSIRQSTPRFESHHNIAAIQSGRSDVSIEQEYPRLTANMPPPQIVPRKRQTLSAVDEVSRRSVTSSRSNQFDNSGLAGDEEERGRLTVESSGKRHKWIDDIVAVSPGNFV